MSNQTEFIIRQVIDSWSLQLKHFNKVLDELSDDDMNLEIAPGRNRGIYILGHMIAVHDRMMPLLHFGQPSYPELYETFLKEGDKPDATYPSMHDLRFYWAEVNRNLMTAYLKLSTDEWMEKHTAVSAEDFAKEPHRNRLNVLLSRTNHLSYHFGQLILLKNKTIRKVD
jgi:hypothetical protein